jgi:signal transduction histidine kinase
MQMAAPGHGEASHEGAREQSRLLRQLKRSPRFVSVGRRLGTLIAVEALAGTLLVLLGLTAMQRLRSDVSFARFYITTPANAVVTAGQKAVQLIAELHALRAANDADPGRVDEIEALSGEIDAFLRRYQSEWVTATSPPPVLAWFQEALRGSGIEDRIAQEAGAIARAREAHDEIAQALHAAPAALPVSDSLLANCERLRGALRELIEVNAAMADAALSHIEYNGRRTMILVLLLGIGSVFLAALLGLHVHRAIAPRIRRLVLKIRRFQEVGINEPANVQGPDEIAILANALDTSFEAIAARDQQRERFLATIAHELKTPLTTILGFAQAVRPASANPVMLERALEVIARQSARLARVTDEVLTAASARSGELPFRPQPVDLVEIVRKAGSELGSLLPERPIQLELPVTAPILADEKLLRLAVETLFAFGNAVLPPSEPVQLYLREEAATWSLVLDLSRCQVSLSELEYAFSPFGFVQHEGNGSLRTAVGLYLGREVARLHGGKLTLEKGERCLLCLELPR